MTNRAFIHSFSFTNQFLKKRQQKTWCFFISIYSEP